MISKEEQETTVTYNAADKIVHIYTSIPRDLERLREYPSAYELVGDEDAGTFYIPVEDFQPLNGFKRTRKKMTPEQREAQAARLEVARAKRGTNGDE